MNQKQLNRVQEVICFLKNYRLSSQEEESISLQIMGDLMEFKASVIMYRDDEPDYLLRRFDDLLDIAFAANFPDTQIGKKTVIWEIFSEGTRHDHVDYLIQLTGRR